MASSSQQYRRDLGLYLHIPFCLRKCPYCSFFSLAGRSDLHNRYIAAIKKQITAFCDENPPQPQRITSIFFGGGTPTLLSATHLADLLKECLQTFVHEEDVEISIEANPATIDLQGLQILRQAGFNRLSLGVQSFNDRELYELGRPHSADDAISIVASARSCGFTNISLDLMYGLPGQDVQTWHNNLALALELAPEHLSLYELTIEPNTPFFYRQQQGTLLLPDEETVLTMLDVTQQLTTAKNLQRYEISNYARFGYRCRHNITYWKNGSYIGFGPGAVSNWSGTRCRTLHDVEQYCEAMEQGREVWLEKERLDHETQFRETIIMGLRMVEGVSLERLARQFHIKADEYYGATLSRLIAQNLVTIRRNHLQLTEQGLLLANQVMAELV